MIRSLLQNALVLALIVAAACLLVGRPAAAETATDSYEYTVRSGDSLLRIASRHRAEAGWYATDDLLSAIREANGVTGSLIRPGQKLTIPVRPARPHPVVVETVADGAPIRGIYLTAPVCSSERVFDRIDRFVQAGGNTVVFDVKDADGGVSFRSRQELASWGKGRGAPLITDVGELIARLQARRLHVVARVACFLDGDLGRSRPDLALHAPDGSVWAERDQVWVDPANPEVHEYVIGLAREMAAAGVDEVQFDYVRFPTNGWRGDAAAEKADVADRRRGIVTGFLAKADAALEPWPVTISADLYGIMAWGRLADAAVTGQHIGDIARHVDVICPMVYPSHYKDGYMGYERPADHPGFFVGEPTRRFLRKSGGEATVRPWLQAFPYRVREYGSEYVAVQIDAAMEAGAEGWCLWSPSSRYDRVLAAVRPDTQPTLLARLVQAAAMGPVDEPRSPLEQ